MLVPWARPFAHPLTRDGPSLKLERLEAKRDLDLVASGSHYKSRSALEGACVMHINAIRANIFGFVAAICVGGLSGEAAAGTMWASDYLFPGQSLVAPGCYYRMDMQSDGNLVIYAGAGGSRPIWSIGSRPGAGSYAVMQSDGNFVVRNGQNRAVWAAGTDSALGYRASYVAMQDDGNFVAYAYASDADIYPGYVLLATWSTRTAGQALGASPCLYRQEVTHIQGGIDRAGGDYAWYTSPDYLSCARDCVYDSRCKAFTHRASDQICWLKGSVPNATSNGSLVSGNIYGR